MLTAFPASMPDSQNAFSNLSTWIAALLQKFGSVLSFLSASIMLLTVLSMPWMLGGVVPLARLVLLVGAIAAVVLSMLANLLQKKLPNSLPAIVLPILGLALLGAFQLRAADESPAASMEHAVQEAVLPADIPDVTNTLIPADTRSTIATLLALALIAFVAFEQVRTTRAVVACSLLIFANGIAIASVGMTHIYKDKHFFLNEVWSLGDTKALVTVFSTFVNPNNAAGWLCLCVAVAAGWITWHLQPARQSPSLRRGRLRISFFGRLWQRGVEFLADLTVWQIITLTGAALVAAGVAATQSRGGIVSLAAAIILTALCRTTIRSFPIVLLLLAGFGFATFGVLQWLDLDAGVVSEMETLKDLNQAAGSRPAHWLDSLNVVRDFPLFGTGLGSYRFATPAYSTHHTGVWFRNADNHYVDMVVEGGIVGLLLFVSIGAIGLMTGFAAWQQSKTKSRNAEGPKLSRRELSGIGTAVILGTLTQAAAAFLDYGVGLPAASSMLVLIIAVAAGVLVEGQVPATLKEAGSLRPGAKLVTPLQLVVLVLAATQIQDQVSAVHIDETIVESHRILNTPVQAERLLELSDVQGRLLKTMEERPDDPEGWRTLTLLANARFRWEVLQMSRGESLLTNPKFSRLWDNVTVQLLIVQLAEVERQQPLAANRLRQQLLTALATSALPDLLEATQRSFPLMPSIADERAAVAVLMKNADEFDHQMATALFSDPSNAASLFKIGSLGLRIDRADATRTIWKRCLLVAPDYRPLVLTDALLQWSFDETMELFGPRSYAACVQAAEKCPSRELREELWRQCDDFWAKIETPVDAETALVRIHHLVSHRKYAEALAWLESIMSSHGENVDLRKNYALLLEEDGQLRNALTEWHGILFLEPGNDEAEAAISRINNLKSPTDGAAEKRY